MVSPIQTARRWWKGEGEASFPRSLRTTAGQSPPRLSDLPADPPWLARLDEAGVPRSLTYPSTTLARLLDETTDRFGDAVALQYSGRRWTYRALRQDVNRLAGGLAQRGVRRGDRVLIALPNCPEFVTSFFAVQKLGGVVVNVGPLLGVDDLQRIISLTTPQVVIALDLLAPTMGRAGKGSTVRHWLWSSLQGYQNLLKRFGYQFKLWHNGGNNHSGHNGNGSNQNGSSATHETLEDVMAEAPARPPTIQPDPDDVAVLQPTGGTTGGVKLAQLTHRNLICNATQVAVWMGTRPGQERILTVLPMFHVYGLTACLLTGVLSASSLILVTRFGAGEIVDLIHRHRPTVFSLVPAMAEAICDELDRRGQSFAKDALKLCISGSAPLPEATAKRFERTTGIRLCEGYGLSEASPVTHANLPTGARIGTIGLPLSDTRVRVVDLNDPSRDVDAGEPGEMFISGPQVMKGYFADPEQTAHALSVDASGVTWLHTGDVVTVDPDGYFHVVDRCKDMINHSGLKIYPAKVERVLRTHPLVVEAAVVGRPDATHTERAVAVVVVRGGMQDHARLAVELRSLCREHLAPYEVPSSIEFRDELPKSPLGKVLKKELRDDTVARSREHEPADISPVVAALPPDHGGDNGSGNGPVNGPGKGKEAA